MDYYLPEYALASAEIGSQGEANAGALTKVDFDRVTADWVSTDGTHDWHVVIMDAELLPFVDATVELTSAGSGIKGYLTLQSDEAFIYEDGRFRVEDADAEPR